MFARAPVNSLLHFFETNDAWRLSYPSTCVFHGSGPGDDMRALYGRPNFVATKEMRDTVLFVAFEPMALLQERDGRINVFVFIARGHSDYHKVGGCWSQRS